MKLEDLSPELLEEAKACKTKEEFLAFCKKHLITLGDDELEALAGGTQECNIGIFCPSNAGGFCMGLN